MAVAKVAIGDGPCANDPFAVDRFDLDAGLRNLLPVGARVHVDGAAETPGDARELVHAGEPLVNGFAGEACQWRCRPDAELCALEVLQVRVGPAQLDDKPPKPLVADQ